MQFVCIESMAFHLNEHCRRKPILIMCPWRKSWSPDAEMCPHHHRITSATIPTSEQMTLCLCPFSVIYLWWFLCSLMAWVRASALPLGFSFAVLGFFHLLIRKLDRCERESLKAEWCSQCRLMENKWIFIFQLMILCFIIHWYGSWSVLRYEFCKFFL